RSQGARTALSADRSTGDSRTRLSDKAVRGRMTKFFHSSSLPSLPSCKTSLSGFTTTGHHRLELEPMRGPVSWKALEQKETKVTKQPREMRPRTKNASVLNAARHAAENSCPTIFASAYCKRPRPRQDNR